MIGLIFITIVFSILNKYIITFNRNTILIHQGIILANLYSLLIYLLYDIKISFYVSNLIFIVKKVEHEYDSTLKYYFYLIGFLSNHNIFFSTIIFMELDNIYYYSKYYYIKKLIILNLYLFNIYLNYDILIQFIIFNIYFIIDSTIHEKYIDLNTMVTYIKLLLYPENKLIQYLDGKIQNEYNQVIEFYISNYLYILPRFNIINKIEQLINEKKYIKDMILIYPKYKNYIIYRYIDRQKYDKSFYYMKKYHMNYLTFRVLSHRVISNIKSKYYEKMYNYAKKIYRHYHIRGFKKKDIIFYVIKKNIMS